jgi:glutaconate CoA-transferase subunit B
MSNEPYKIDELMSVCISRRIQNGDMVAQGIATPLVAAGYMLAKLTHAPDVSFMSAIGQTINHDWAPLGLSTVEETWIPQALMSIGFATAVCELLPRYGPMEYFRPAQVDPYGNFNNVFIGGDYAKPRLRLPGAGGIPDVTVFEDHVCLYVPRHSRATFVPHLDFRSGLGNGYDRVAGHGPRYLISDLGQFDYGGAEGRMRLTTIHPGVELGRIENRTGFAFELADPLPETRPPTPLELHLLRTQIDPLGTRGLETLRGSARRERLRRILEQEAKN